MTGVIFKLHKLALPPYKGVLARAFPFSWKEVVWAVVGVLLPWVHQGGQMVKQPLISALRAEVQRPYRRA